MDNGGQNKAHRLWLFVLSVCAEPRVPYQLSIEAPVQKTTRLKSLMSQAEAKENKEDTNSTQILCPLLRLNFAVIRKQACSCF